MTTFLIIFLFIIYVFLPAALIVWLWKRKGRNRLNWLARLLASGTALSFLFLTGRWDWFGYHLRLLLVAAYLWAAYKSYLRTKHLPFFVKNDVFGWYSFGLKTLFLLLIIPADISAVKGYFLNGKPVELLFPLKNGVYYVGQGGNSRAINYHHVNRSQRYALDINKLNTWGMRCKGICPEDLSKYEIFGDTLYSPCEGMIEEVENGLLDMKPGQKDSISIATNRMNLAGNRVIIRSIGAKIVLAHMMQGSVLVKKGDSVKVGQPLGRVGNSGNTSEPHLHIHAVKDSSGVSVLTGEGVPIVFNGRFLVRNSLVFE